MSDFKVGDRIWWFEYPEQCLGKNEDIAICSDIITKVVSPTSGNCLILQVGAIGLSYVDVYKSREEAFDGLIKYLERLRDE